MCTEYVHGIIGAVLIVRSKAHFRLVSFRSMSFLPEADADMKPVLVIHGGAAAFALIERDNIDKSDIEDGLIDAANAGFDILQSGGSALDAVQRAVLNMEDNPIFNCG